MRTFGLAAFLLIAILVPSGGAQAAVFHSFITGPAQMESVACRTVRERVAPKWQRGLSTKTYLRPARRMGPALQHNSRANPPTKWHGSVSQSAALPLISEDDS